MHTHALVSLYSVSKLSLFVAALIFKLRDVREVLGVCLMKILRRRSKKRYLEKKRVYAYERFSVNIPAKFGDAVEPFLNKDLDMAVKKEGDDTLVIVLVPRENVSAPRKNPAKTTA